MKHVLRRALVLMLFMCGAVSLATQETDPVLDDILARITGEGIVRGDFVQTKTIQRISRTLRSTGTFTISRDDGIIWNTAKPFPLVMVVGPAGMTQITAQGDRTFFGAEENPVFAHFSQAIQAVFSGNRDMLYDRFQVTADTDNLPSWHIVLRPKDGTIRSIIDKIELSGDTTLNNIVVHEPSGDVLSYVFSNHAFSATLTHEEKELFTGKGS